MARPNDIELRSRLTCPSCGHETDETMPSDACIVRFDCPSCGAILKPLAGDCCVFCSYGTVPCPPIQQAALERNQGFMGRSRS